MVLNSLILISEKTSKIASQFIILFFIGKIYGAQTLGLYAYITAIYAFFFTLSSLGLHSTVLRVFIYSKCETFSKSVVLTSKLLGNIICFMLCLLTFLLLKGSGSGELLLLFLASYNLFNLNMHWAFHRQASGKFILESVISIISTILSTAIKIFFIINFSYENFFYVCGIEWLVVFIISSFTTGFFNFYISFRKHHLSSIYKLLKKSSPYLLSSLAVILYTKIDQIMIFSMLGQTAAGEYSLAVRIVEGTTIFPAVLSTVMSPKIISAYKENSNYQSHTIFLIQSSILAFAFVCTFVQLCGNIFFEIMFKDQFENSVIYLKILIFSCFFSYIGVARSPIIISEQLQKYSMLYILIGLASNIVFNYILIKRYEVIGAIISTLASQYIVVFLAPLLFKKTRKLITIQIKSFNFLIYKEYFNDELTKKNRQ